MRWGFWILLVILLLPWLTSSFFGVGGSGGPGGARDRREIPYSEFIQDVDQGKVSEVWIAQDSVRGTFKDQVGAQASGAALPGPVKEKPQAAKDEEKEAKSRFITARIEDPQLAERLEKAGVKFTGLRESGGVAGALSWLLPFLLLMAFWSFIFRRMSGGAGGAPGGGFLSLGKNKAKIYVERDLKTRFDDVAGVDEAKEELQEIVNFLKKPESYSQLGGRMPKGVLLVGAPGTGKTLLARAVAGEAGVPFFSINGSEFVELFVGLGAARVRDLFEQARAQAPCILFIDELDALGKARGIAAITGSSNDEKEQTLNQLLAEMDGFDSSKGIILLGATNRPEVLDPALLRAGRFDRTVVVEKPDRAGREKILSIHTRKLKLAPSVDLPVIASLTAGFSGADLANLANEAALIATRRGAKAVEPPDFTAAIERTIAGLERRTKVLAPEEKRRVAFHEMGHAIVSLSLGHDEQIHKVSVIPRSIGSLGYTIRRPTEDRYLMMRDELEAKIAIALGGRAAEMIYFDDVSTGAGDDLDKATEIARAMVTRYGMGAATGLAVLERDSAPFLQGNLPPMRSFEYSEATARRIDAAIQDLLANNLARAKDAILQYDDVVRDAVEILLTQETLDEAELKALWDKHVERKVA